MTISLLGTLLKKLSFDFPFKGMQNATVQANQENYTFFIKSCLRKYLEEKKVGIIDKTDLKGDFDMS